MPTYRGAWPNGWSRLRGRGLIRHLWVGVAIRVALREGVVCCFILDGAWSLLANHTLGRGLCSSPQAWAKSWNGRRQREGLELGKLRGPSSLGGFLTKQDPGETIFWGVARKTEVKKERRANGTMQSRTWDWGSAPHPRKAT